MSTSINPRTHTIKLHKLYNSWPTVERFSPVNAIFQRIASSAAPHVRVPSMNKDTLQQRQNTSCSQPDGLFMWWPPAAKELVCLLQWFWRAQAHPYKLILKKEREKKTNVRHCKEGILKCQSLRNILLTRFCYFAQIYVVLPWESVCFCNQKFTLNQMLMSDFLLVIYQLYAAWRSWSKVLLRAG